MGNKKTTSKFQINLLPEEFSVKQKEQQKFNRVQSLSVFAVLILVFFSSVVIALRILQSQKINQLESNTVNAENKISTLKQKEATLFILKNRLTTVNQILKAPSKQTELYYFVTGLLPSNITVSSISTDKFGNVSFAAVVPDADSLDVLLNNLTDQAAFEKISKVEIESLSRGKDNLIRANIKVTSKS